MPTTRPRHSVTETDRLAHALDSAARIWPELRDDRGALLRKLIERGEASVVEDAQAQLAERRRAIRDTAGGLTGVYPPNARQELLEEWPE